MEKEHYKVTRLMSERIDSEMKRHNQTNLDIAEILEIHDRSFSRLKNGYKRKEDIYIKDSRIETLVKCWGVRKNYLLGIDDIRTNGDLIHNVSESKQLLLESANSFLNVLGINLENCEMLCFKLSDIYYYQSIGVKIEKMLSIIDPYILSPRDNWERFKERITNKELDIEFEEHCFITNGLLFEDTLKDDFIKKHEHRADDLTIVTIRYFIHNCPKVTIDGQFIGYSRNYDGNMNIIADTMKSLAKSLIDDEKRKNIFIYDVENSIKSMEKEKSN